MCMNNHYTKFKQEKNAKRHYSRVFFTHLIRIIMSNMEEHVLIQIFKSFKLCTTFYSLLNVKCNIKIQILIEPVHEISNNLVCATSKASDQRRV